MTDESWNEVRETISDQALCIDPFSEISLAKYTIKWIEDFNISSFRE